VFLGWNGSFSEDKRLADDRERDKAGRLTYRRIRVMREGIEDGLAGNY
jgi:hypothetical protein